LSDDGIGSKFGSVARRSAVEGLVRVVEKPPQFRALREAAGTVLAVAQLERQNSKWALLSIADASDAATVAHLDLYGRVIKAL
jgi:hypothetical protein